MKVKCRGYEGELMELSATTEARSVKEEYKVLTYEVKIAIINAIITFENVENEEIEFVKE